MGTSKVVKVRRVEFPDWRHSHVEHALLTCTSLKHVPKMQAVPQGLSLPNTYSKLFPKAFPCQIPIAVT